MATRARKTSKPTTVDDGRWKRVNRAQLSMLIGCHPETVTAYVRLGMPVETQGGHGLESIFDAPTCLKWWRDNQGKASAKEVEQTRAYSAQANLNELKLAQQRAELLPRDQVVYEGQTYTKAWAGQVRALPRRARQSGVVTTPEAEAQLEDLCRQVLTEISGWKTPAAAARAAKGAVA